MEPTTTQPKGSPAFDLLGTWTPIKERLPNMDDIIACCAEHHRVGLMYWAGLVVEVHGKYAVMEVRNEFSRRFVITHDTLWLKLPVPNDKLTHGGPTQ